MNDAGDMRDTRRWKEGAVTLPGLSEALHSLGTERVSDAQVASLEARLAPLMAAPTHGGSGAGQGGAGVATQLARAWPWLGAGLLGTLMLWSLMPHATPVRAPAPRPTGVEAAPSVDTLAPGAEPSTVTSPTFTPAPSAMNTKPSSPRSARKPGDVPKPSARTVAQAPEAELLLLREAQSALNRSASAALSRLDEHARLYPSGLFVQEREMLRIEAELTLGRRSAALQRADQFAKRFGQSTYRARIDKLLATHRTLKDREIVVPDATQ